MAAHGINSFEAPDPNLVCSVCCEVFNEPMRTECGHLFCRGCITEWLNIKPDCPECRAHMGSLSVDRLATSLVANLPGHCPLRASGCTWVGKRGQRTAHLSRDCPCAHVHCPNKGCTAEVPRSELVAHLRSCGSGSSGGLVECPFGCGVCCPAAALDAHKNECLHDPRKLLAVVKHLRSENEQLAAENRRLRADKREATPALGDDDDVGPRTEFSGPRRKVRRVLT